MKERELRKYSVCSLCGGKIGETGIPMFWVVTVERHGLKLDAIHRQTGLGMMLGNNGYLAQIMGPDEDMTVPVLPKITLSICEQCCTENVCVAQLGELHSILEDK